MNEILCPKCQRPGAVKNGHVASSGKQNWLRRACGRQFVANLSRHSMNDALSFSKKLSNHIAALKLFVCEYNASLNAHRFECC